MKRLLLCGACALLTGCMVGPDYHQPKLDAPATFGEQARAPEATASSADISRWWAQLGDPVLDSLVDRALAQNLDVQTAASRLREARSQVTVARAALLPSVSASAIAARRDAQSGGGPLGGGSSSSTAASAATTAMSGGLSLPKHLQVYSLGADASWELDIFGGVRRGVEAAKAQADAADWQARDAQVALTAQVARAYLSLRLAQARQAEAQADVARLNDLLSLVAARSRAGIVTELDVNQQRSALQARQAELPQLDQQARAAIHALGVLLGQPPMSLDAELSPPRPLPQAPATLPVGLPSDLLNRRPDVRAAERRLAAATAQIGVAVADLYPKINLLGLASFAGTDFSSLLSRRNFSTIGAADGSWTLFDAGRGRATVAARRDEAEQADLAYRKAMLTALQEVEDALSSYGADREREARLTQDAATANDTAALAEARYKAGLSAFINVLDARAAVRQANDELVSARAARIGDTVALFTALGGGWRAS